MESDISIHAVHADCDYCKDITDSIVLPFQSTQSMRTATVTAKFYTNVDDISIHAVHADCDGLPGEVIADVGKISIHAVHADCDNAGD